MKTVMRLLVATLMAVILSLGALAPMSVLGQRNNNRPEKKPEKIKEPDKQPRGNTNSQGNRNKP
jgi:hypothetical protein